MPSGDLLFYLNSTYIFLHSSLPYNFLWQSIVTHLVYYFLSHFQRFIIEGFFMDSKCDLSDTLVQFTQLHSCSKSLSYILGLVYLVAFLVQFTQLHFSLPPFVTPQFSSLSRILSLVNLVAFQLSSLSDTLTQFTQLHFRFSLLNCTLIQLT